MCMHTLYIHMPLQSLSLLAFVPFYPDHSRLLFLPTGQWVGRIYPRSESRQMAATLMAGGAGLCLLATGVRAYLTRRLVGRGKKGVPKWIEATQIDRGYVAVRAGLLVHFLFFLFLLLLLLLFACLLACLLVCLFACLFVCLLACLICLFVCLLVCLFVICLYAICLSVCLSACLFVCLFVRLLDCFLSCLHKRF